MTASSREVALSLRLDGAEIVTRHLVTPNTTVSQLKQALRSFHLEDFALVYQNQLLQDTDLVFHELFAEDTAPILFVAVFRHSSPVRVVLRFLSSNKHNLEQSVEAATVGELKTMAAQILKHKAGGGILVDLAVGGRSLIRESDAQPLSSLLVGGLQQQQEEDEDGGGAVMLVDVVSGGGTKPTATAAVPEEMPLTDVAFYAKFVDAQFAKDRLSKINDMNFNHQVLSAAIDSVSAAAGAAAPAKFERDVLLLRQQHREASLLLLKSLELYTAQFASPSAAAAAAASEALPAAAPAPAAAADPAAAAAAAERRAAMRQQMFAGLDFGLLFKLALMVGLLGYDMARQELACMCLGALVIYLASMGLLRLPQFAQTWMQQRGRIPHAAREGFFVDLYSVVLSLVLSVLPAWKAVGEDVPAALDGDGVVPVAAVAAG